MINEGLSGQKCCFCCDLRLGVILIALVEMVENGQQILSLSSLLYSFLPEYSKHPKASMNLVYIYLTFQILHLLAVVCGLMTTARQKYSLAWALLTWILATYVNSGVQLIALVYIVAVFDSRALNIFAIGVVLFCVPKNMFFTLTINKYRKLLLKGLYITGLSDMDEPVTRSRTSSKRQSASPFQDTDLSSPVFSSDSIASHIPNLLAIPESGESKEDLLTQHACSRDPTELLRFEDKKDMFLGASLRKDSLSLRKVSVSENETEITDDEILIDHSQQRTSLPLPSTLEQRTKPKSRYFLHKAEIYRNSDSVFYHKYNLIPEEKPLPCVSNLGRNCSEENFGGKNIGNHRNGDREELWRPTRRNRPTSLMLPQSREVKNFLCDYKPFTTKKFSYSDTNGKESQTLRGFIDSGEESDASLEMDMDPYALERHYSLGRVSPDIELNHDWDFMMAKGETCHRNLDEISSSSSSSGSSTDINPFVTSIDVKDLLLKSKKRKHSPGRKSAWSNSSFQDTEVESSNLPAKCKLLCVPRSPSPMQLDTSRSCIDGQYQKSGRRSVRKANALSFHADENCLIRAMCTTCPLSETKDVDGGYQKKRISFSTPCLSLVPRSAPEAKTLCKPCASTKTSETEAEQIESQFTWSPFKLDVELNSQNKCFVSPNVLTVQSNEAKRTSLPARPRTLLGRKSDLPRATKS